MRIKLLLIALLLALPAGAQQKINGGIIQAGTTPLAAMQNQPANATLCNPNGVASAPVACTPSQARTALGLPATVTQDATNASNLASGAVPGARLPNVVAVSTASLALSGIQAVDGINGYSGMAVLLTAQSTGSQNGPWLMQSGAWTRPAWYPTAGTTQAAGAIVPVLSGTLYGGALWQQTAAAPITIDTTATTWAVVQLADSTVKTQSVPGVTTQDAANALFASALATPTGISPITVTNAGAGIWTFALTGQFGSGYLSKNTTSGNLQLCPFNGNLIFVNGAWVTIPGSCISLSASALTANTFYYVYAYLNGSTLTLEASTTGHSTNTTYGNEQKQGDATRSIVGAAYVITGPAFADTGTQRLVESWFNRQPKRCVTTFSTNRTVTSTTYGEVNSEIECQFIVLNTPGSGGASIVGYSWSISAGVANNTAADGCAVSAAFDSTTNAETQQGAELLAANNIGNLSTAGTVMTLTEGSGSGGLHYITMLGKVINGGTCTWNSAYSSLNLVIPQ